MRSILIADVQTQYKTYTFTHVFTLIEHDKVTEKWNKIKASSQKKRTILWKKEHEYDVKRNSENRKRFTFGQGWK